MDDALEEHRTGTANDSAANGAENGVEADLAALLAQMGALLLSAETVDAALRLVTASAAEVVPGSVGAGVSLMDERGKRSRAASDPRVEQADALQYELDAGPCVTAWRDQTTVRINDVASEIRWPDWTAAVAPLGIGSVLSTALRVRPEAIGAIKVYGAQPAAFDSHAERLLLLFAQQAGILLAHTRNLVDARELSANLTLALASRDLIGQAKGILIAQGAADDDAAFAMLVSASQRTQTKLHEVARQLVAAVIERHSGRSDGSSRPSPAP